MMIVVMQPEASMQEKSAIVSWAEDLGFKIHLSTGSERTIIGVIGDDRVINREQLERMSGVERVVPVLKPFKIASREFKPNDTQFTIGDYVIGGKDLVIMAGPCSVESRSQILETAHACKEAGAHILRGGAFKPRSSPYSFQGLGEEGLKYLAEAREQYGMPIITEVMEPSLVPLVAEYADILQIGARNMQNYAAACCGRIAASRAAKARHEQSDRRVADERGVHFEPRQHAGDDVRTRHSHL